MTADVVLSEDVAFRGWRALRIERGALTLHLVPQIGGRIMGIAHDGQELAFVQPERAGSVPSETERAALEAWRKSLGFPLWGGGKTWIAPESRFPGGAPYPDLDSGPYEISVLQAAPERVTVRMESAVCRDTGLRLSRTLEVSAETPGWRVVQRAVNHGDTPWEGGLWDVLMLLRPAEVFWPAAEAHVFEDKGDPAAGRAALRPGGVLCAAEAEFKLGAQLTSGWIAARLGRVGYLRRFPLDTAANYAHGWPAEVYNSEDHPYLEIESHGPMTRLEPGEGAAMTVCEEVAPWHEIAAKLKMETYA